MKFDSLLSENHDLIFREIHENVFVNVKNRFDNLLNEAFTSNQVTIFLNLPVRTLLIYNDESYSSNLEKLEFDK